MKSSQKILRVVLLVAIFQATNAIYGQKTPAYMTPGEEKRDEEGYTIYNGYVVAMGVLLPRPYFVALRDDTVWINNIAFDPPRDNPNPEPFIVYSDTIKAKIGVWSDLRDNYPLWRDSLGEQKAQEMVRQKYENNWVVSKIEFSESGKELWVTCIGGVRQNVLQQAIVSHWAHRVINMEDEARRRREEKQRSLKSTRNSLQRGCIILFGYSDSDRQSLNPEEAQRIIELVRNIKNGSISMEAFKADMDHILNGGKILRDIINHYESWTNDIK